MTTEAYLSRWATTAIPDGHFRCAMCGGVFPCGDDDEARAEAEAKGVDPDDSGLVCDTCYTRTPWGRPDFRLLVPPADRPSDRPPGEFVARARRRVDGRWVTTRTY